jgi:Flp pilus assembly protein TadG
VHGRLSRRTAGRPHDHGAVAVEFALVLPLLLALLMGIVTAGLGYNRVLGIADGVRGGARFGATTVNDASWGSTVQQQTMALTALNVGGQTVLTSSMVCAQLVRAPAIPVQSSSCALATLPPADPPLVVAGTCLVKVWAEIPVEFNLIVDHYTPIVQRQSVTLYERGTC